MKKTMAFLALTSLVVVGCNKREMNESAGAAKDQISQAADSQKDALNQQKKSVEQSADQAQEQISAQAKAEKQRIESQADAQQAQIEAQKKQVEAQAAAAKADANSQEKVNEAAGAANTPATPPAATTQGADNDQALTKQVQESLTSQNAGITGVTVTAMGGKVTLKGTVKTEAEKQAMETQAKAVSGVTSVDNQLEVKSE